jgi:hypothetical protein
VALGVALFAFFGSRSADQKLKASTAQFATAQTRADGLAERNRQVEEEIEKLDIRAKVAEIRLNRCRQVFKQTIQIGIARTASSDGWQDFLNDLSACYGEIPKFFTDAVGEAAGQ